MADLILHKRSSTASAVPSAGSIALGELAINTADGRLFLKKGDGTVVDVTSIGGIQGLTAALAGKEPTISAGTSAQFWRGDKTWQSFGDATRAQTLEGLASPTNTAIAAADTALAAFAKLQGQVTARMTNPMTTAGDMIRGGTSGAPERVAAGTNGHVMTMVAGVPGWAAMAGLFGPGQTYQTLTGSRAIATTYTNSTGATILVNVIAQMSLASSSLYATVDGVNIFGSYSPSASEYASLTFVVAPGKTYIVRPTIGTASSHVWTEMR